MATGDTALWLHNKLGSTDDLWSGRIICSQLSREKLINIQYCFHDLQSHVKVKLLLSFLHISKRHIEQWQQDLEEIVLLGINDQDPWVATVGEIMREYPSTGALLLVGQDAHIDSNMAVCLEEIKQMAQKCNVSMMPLECQYLNKGALAAVAGQIPESSKHFTIKRRPKSAALRAEIIQKSSETVLNKRSHSSSSNPIKSRSFAKKFETSSNFTPLKMTPGRSPFSSSDFRSPTTPMNRLNSSLGGRSPITPIAMASRSSASKKDSKIKLLEIEEMPVGAKEAKRRKKIADMEALEAQKKEKEAQAAAGSSQNTAMSTDAATTTVSYTPDYAAGLIPSAASKMPMTVLSVSNPSLAQPSPAYLPSRQITQNVTISSGLTSSLQSSNKPNLSEQLKQQLLQPQTRTTTITASTLPAMTPILIAQQPSSAPSNPTMLPVSLNNVLASAATLPPSSPLLATAVVRPVMVQQIVRPQAAVPSQTPPPQILTVTQQPQQSTSQPPPAPAAAKTGLSLTKDQMREAQEMFKVSNKVSRPEKALILGFMAGSRENPCAQRGDILNIKLSEKEEVVLMPDGTKKKKIEDTIFQMNYATGEWKRFLNLREVDVS